MNLIYDYADSILYIIHPILISVFVHREHNRATTDHPGRGIISILP